MNNQGTRELPRPILMLVTEPMEQIRLAEIVRQAVAGGVNMVQLRDKTLSPDALTRAAAMLKLVAPETILLVNGSPASAAGAGAQGVHMPEQGIQTTLIRQELGTDCLVGRSVHSVDAAMKAEREGADYVTAGTIFASSSHPEATPAGMEFLREVCVSVSIPVIAIGGITTENAPLCLRAGAAGIAVLSSIMQAADPRAAAQQYRASLSVL